MLVERQVAAAELQDVAAVPDPVGDEIGDERVAPRVVPPVADAHREPVEGREPVDGQHD